MSMDVDVLTMCVCMTMTVVKHMQSVVQPVAAESVTCFVNIYIVAFFKVCYSIVAMLVCVSVCVGSVDIIDLIVYAIIVCQAGCRWVGLCLCIASAAIVFHHVERIVRADTSTWALRQ